MKAIARRFITTHGIMFQIERNGKIVSEALGLPNHESSTSKPFIGMLQDADVAIGDWLINPNNDRFYVTDKISDYAFSEFQQYKIFYLTEAQYNSRQKIDSAPTFHIENAYGSVIGTQTGVTLNYGTAIREARNQVESTDSSDKEDLQQIINLLEMVVNDQVTPHKGLFSKFSAVMERNSWITGSISAALLSWLTSQIH